MKTTGLVNRQWILARVPDGFVRESDFAQRTAHVGELADGEALGRARWFTFEAAMRAWLAALPTYTASKRFPQGRNPLALAFPRRRGGYRDEAHVIKWSDWKAILKRAGIARRFRFHDLRHTCASALVSGMWGRRWSLEEVKEVLGHTDIAVTQRYAHLATDAIALATKATNGGATTTAADATRATEERAPPGDATHVSEAAVSPRSRSELASELAKAKIALANRAKNKCATGDSNARPTAPEAVALSS